LNSWLKTDLWSHTLQPLKRVQPLWQRSVWRHKRKVEAMTTIVLKATTAVNVAATPDVAVPPVNTTWRRFDETVSAEIYGQNKDQLCISL
jgi:hypothetical protein